MANTVGTHEMGDMLQELYPFAVTYRDILTVQATVIQKIENQWQDAETTDELDDPIRR